jgi:hypothetical protein
LRFWNWLWFFIHIVSRTGYQASHPRTGPIGPYLDREREAGVRWATGAVEPTIIS